LAFGEALEKQLYLLLDRNVPGPSALNEDNPRNSVLFSEIAY
jgi:hypothetical protein